MKRVYRHVQFGLIVSIVIMIAIDLSLRVVSKPAGWQSVDVVTVVLSALSVMLAAMTIFLGVAAIMGYFHLKEVAALTAKSVARGVAKEAAEKEARIVAEEVAGRTARELADQESGQGDGYDYARGAASDPGNGPDTNDGGNHRPLPEGSTG